MTYEITREADLAKLPMPFEQSKPNSGPLITERLSEIEAKAVSWLWPSRIARGKLTIIAGNPGLGKSQITASIAAVVATGGVWPVDRERCERGDVLFLTAEDDAADTLRPRLEAAGADLERIHIIRGVRANSETRKERHSRSFSLERDLNALEEKLAELGSVAALVIDPISAYLGGTDSHNNAEVRGLLAPLSELAARQNSAIICVSHLNKAAGMEVLMRVSGSLAFVGVARSVWLVAQDPDEKTRRLFLPVKNNLAPDIGGLAYSIEGATVKSSTGPIDTSLIKWEPDAVRRTADEIMQQQASGARSSALNEAKEWLEEVLADGPLPVTDILERAKADGLKERTLRRAQKSVGIIPAKADFNGGWEWSLPPKVAKTAEDGQ